METLHESLWYHNQDLANACLRHPFVEGLSDGTLDRDAFRRYVAQDAYYLRAFIAGYAVAAAKCSHRSECVRRFHDLLGGALEELKLHAGYSLELGIDLEEVVPYPAVSAYTDFLMHTAWAGGVDEIVAAMTPCMRLYAYLGQELAPRNRQDKPYRSWIETYSSAEFDRLAGELEEMLDELADDCSRVRDAYRYAMQCEFDFFSAPLEGAPGHWAP